MCAILIAPHHALAQVVVVSDNFADGNDTANPAWTHLDAGTGSTGQTWSISGGQYRMTAPTNGDVVLDEFDGFGFVGSYTGPKYTDAKVEADMVEITTAFDSPTFMGVALRLNGDNRQFFADFDQGLKGYGYQWEPTARNGEGEMVLSLIWAGGTQDIGAQAVSLDGNKDYRFSLEMIGNVLHGITYELDDNGNPGPIVGERIRDLVAEPVTLDHDDDPLTDRIPHVPYTEGYSGVYGYSHAFGAAEAAFTVENFRTEGTLATLTGDYNADGKVDAADYVVWRDQNINGPQGYLDWRTNFGKPASGAALGSGGSVPEPASASLVLVGLVILWLSRRSGR
jgi:hypothetical protein